MPLDPKKLASEITEEMGFPLPPSPQLVGWATGVVIELTTNGSATTGGIPGPHKISGLTPVTMAAKVAAAGGYIIVTPGLLAECSGIIAHIAQAAQVTYNGPPPAVGNPDWFVGGKISGMSGPAMAVLVASLSGFPIPTPDLISKCTAIVNHIEKNAVVIQGIIA